MSRLKLPDPSQANLDRVGYVVCRHMGERLSTLSERDALDRVRHVVCRHMGERLSTLCERGRSLMA